MKYRSYWFIFTLRWKLGSHCVIICTCKYDNSGKYKKITGLWNIGHIIPKYDSNTWNYLQDVTQNHWTMKYRSRWPTFTFRSTVGSYQFIIPNNDIHTSNNIQDKRQNYWTMKYRSRWPTFVMLSIVVSHRTNIPSITLIHGIVKT